MQPQALQACPRRGACRRVTAIATRSPATYVPDRQAPNRRAEPEVGMVGFTYIGAAEDGLYGSVVLNLYSRRTVDWSIQVSMASVAAALSRADDGRLA